MADADPFLLVASLCLSVSDFSPLLFSAAPLENPGHFMTPSCGDMNCFFLFLFALRQFHFPALAPCLLPPLKLGLIPFAQVLVALARLIKALGRDSPVAHPLVLPLLAHACAPPSAVPEASALGEDG